MSFKKYIKGSFTVEAALVFPIILFVIISLIYIGFYMHDKVYIKAVIDQAAMKEGMFVKHESEFSNGKIAFEEINKRNIFDSLFGDLSSQKNVLESYLDIKLSRGMFIGVIKEIETEVTHSVIEIRVNVDMDIPFSLVREYFTGKSTDISVSSKVPIHNPAEYARLIEVVYDTSSNVKGFDQIKEKLREFIEFFNKERYRYQ